MQKGNTISRATYAVYFFIAAAVLVVLGIVLTIANIKAIYDLPVIVIGIGVIVAFYALSQYMRRDSLSDVTISSKTAKTFLTNNAIILALLVLVVIICIKERKFMQVRVVLDILTQSSTKLIIALGICFTLLIAGTDLSAGRMVGLASVISCSMLQLSLIHI